LDEAAQAANKALELSAAPKTRAVAELALGYVGARRGKFGDAEAAYQRALTQHPSYAAAKDAVQILSLCRRPTPALLAAVRIAVSGQLLAEPLVTNLSREERLILAAAPQARHGQLLDPPSIASFYYATQLPAGLQFKENSAAGLDVLTAEDRANEQLVKQSLSATNNPSRKSEERSNPF
jgi:tetratricopeptide (TPR) repeat protein